MVTGWLWERERSKMTLRFSIWVTGKRRGHLLRWQALKEDHFSGDSVGNLWELLEEMFLANTQCPGKQIVGQKTACSNFVRYHLESNIEVPQRGKQVLTTFDDVSKDPSSDSEGFAIFKPSFSWWGGGNLLGYSHQFLGKGQVNWWVNYQKWGYGVHSALF